MPSPTSTPDSPGQATRDALLDAAETLFARHGVDATSLRRITGEAGANLASVNYHFGSKEGLVRAVLSRRLGPLNRERIERLDRCLAEAEGPPPVAGIVRAFAEPPLEMMRREPAGHDFARLVMRTFTEPEPRLRGAVMEQFAEVVERFTDALGRALPHLPPAEIHWRFHFVVGAMVHTLGLGFLLERFSGGICDPSDVEGTLDRLVAFAVGGLEQGSSGISS